MSFRPDLASGAEGPKRTGAGVGPLSPAPPLRHADFLYLNNQWLVRCSREWRKVRVTHSGRRRCQFCGTDITERFSA